MNKFTALRYMVRIKKHPFGYFLFMRFKAFYDKGQEANTLLREQFLQFLPFLVGAIITGALAVLYSTIFHWAEQFSSWIFQKNHWHIFWMTPMCFILSWYLVKRLAPFAKGSGIPQVMAALEITTPAKRALIEKLLSIRIIIIKIAASAIKVIGGGISGREGPTIQIGSSVFNQINQWLPTWWRPVSQQNMLIAGAASGLAAAFNTPLGGIIFAIEELSKYHLKRYKSPLFTAVIIAGLSAQGFAGSYLYLGYPQTRISGGMVFLGVFCCAILAGITAASMSKWMLQWMKIIQNSRNNAQQIGWVLLCSMLVSTSIFFFGSEAMGTGKEVMERLLFSEDKQIDWFLPLIRIGGLMASFSFGGAGGVFAPSLSAGACLGALVAQSMHLTGDNANLLILVGMTAFLTGVTRAPFTSTIIIFEMTDRHSVIFFLLAGALIANLLASFVAKKSFYDHLKEAYLHQL